MTDYIALKKTVARHSFFDYIGKWYECGYRKYHTYEHACNVAMSCKEMSNDPALILAAYYHDAVYITGSDSNEKCSAMALLNDAKRMQSLGAVIEWGTVDRAAELILGTSIANHKSTSRIIDPLHAILLDCDLRGLSMPYDKFIDQQKDILEENFLSRDNLFKSAQFLLDLSLSRLFIYHTDHAREHWEDSAKDNIYKLAIEMGI